MNESGIDREDDELLSAFIDAELPAAEASRLLDRLCEDAGLRSRWLELMRCREAMHDASSIATEQPDDLAAVRAVMHCIDQIDADAVTGSSPASLPIRNARAPMLAALSLVLAAIVGVLVFVARTGSTGTTLAAGQIEPPAPAIPVPDRVSPVMLIADNPAVPSVSLHRSAVIDDAARAPMQDDPVLR